MVWKKNDDGDLMLENEEIIIDMPLFSAAACFTLLKASMFLYIL